MARFEVRKFSGRKFLLVIADTREESKLIDSIMGSNIPQKVSGEVTLADGCYEHYIRLEKGTAQK